MVEFFIVHMTNGNEKNAKYILEKQTLELRRSDAVNLAFLGGMCLVMFGFCVLFVVGPGPSDDDDVDWRD